MAELDKQKDELLSIVSHQLATPVSSTKWYLEMMLDGDFGKLSSEQEKHVKSMQTVISNLADLVSMILDVSRIQLGRMKVDRSDVDLAEAIEEILVVIEPKAEARKVKMNVSLPKNIPVAKLDKRLFRMTLENLLSNAIKYSDKDSGEVEFTVKIENGTLTYYVKDNGCGIPESEQDKIFGKLFRASNAQSIDGNGFGLYAAKGAVEALGGSIRFESKENKGTTFFVSLPLND
jgi:signal transduction histidine kinase